MFPANACRTRYAQLISGTAGIPCGIDAESDARHAELERWTLELSLSLLAGKVVSWLASLGQRNRSENLG